MNERVDTWTNFSAINNNGNGLFVFELTAFWGWLMALSKMAELGDTAFIVLRKQPLIFLHW